MENIYIDKISEGIDKSSLVKSFFKDNSLELEFIYSSNFWNTKMLRDFLELICKEIWFDSIMSSRIVLITDELNNNAIEYWSSENWINKLRISFLKNDNKINLNLEVEDDGKGRKPKTALDMETLRAHKLKLWYFNHDSIRWRWLFLIIVKLVERLYFRNSKEWGLIVWVKIKT